MTGLLSLIAVCCIPTVFALSVHDDRNQQVTLAKPAERIISLSPHLTENLFSIGAGPAIVGVVQHSDFPAAAKDIEIIGSHTGLDFERILELKPDIVFGWLSGNSPAEIEKLEALGLTVYLTEPRSHEDVASELLRLGALTGHPQGADEAAERYLEEIEAIKNRYRQREPVRVFYQVWHQPLVTLNGQHLVSGIIRDCGGVNVFDSLEGLAPKVSIESVIAADPDVIIASGATAERPEWLDKWRRYEFLNAVRGSHVYHVNPDWLHRHTLRLAMGMEQLCELINRARLPS